MGALRRLLGRVIRPDRLVADVWSLIREVIDEFADDRVGDLAAGTTFFALLSVPAAALSVVASLGSLDSLLGANLADDVQREVLDFTRSLLTSEGDTVVEAVEQVFVDTNGGLVTASAAFALLSLNRAFAGLIRALDAAYDVVEGRRWWHVRLVALGFTVGALAAIAGASVLLFVVWPALPDTLVVQALRFPAVAMLLVGLAVVVFHIGPHRHTPWRWDVPGAVLAAVGWVALTQGYSLYVRFAGGNVAGAVGAALLALTWLYLIFVVLLVGAELNDVLTRRAGVVEGPREHRVARAVRRRRDQK